MQAACKLGSKSDQVLPVVAACASDLEDSIGNPMSMSEELHLIHKKSAPLELNPPHPLPRRTKIRTTDPRNALEIPMEPEGIASEEPTTVGKVLKETVSKIPDKAALRYKEDDVWKTITYKEYYNLVIKAGKSFLKVKDSLPEALTCLA